MNRDLNNDYIIERLGHTILQVSVFHLQTSGQKSLNYKLFVGARVSGD
jgi:hypothetical protein